LYEANSFLLKRIALIRKGGLKRSSLPTDNSTTLPDKSTLDRVSWKLQ
jgi:hypothetical protein